MRIRKLIKYLSLIIILIFSFSISNAQKRKNPYCYILIDRAEYEDAIDCIEYNLKFGKHRNSYGAYEYFSEGKLYYSIFNHKDLEVNNLDTNALEKSILYFYKALLNNIKEPYYNNIDIKQIGEKKYLMKVLENPTTIYKDARIHYELVNRYLPTLELSLLEHKLTEESRDFLEILLVYKNHTFFDKIED